MDPNATILFGDLPLAAAIPVLSDGPPMDLPLNAVLNEDGSVTLTLAYPCSVKYRVPGTDQVVRSDDYTTLTLRRLKGPDVRAMIAAKDSSQTALALSSGIGLGKLNLLRTVMDAADEADAGRVVSELLGGLSGGLPPHAKEEAGVITLPLLFAASDEAGTVYTEVVFKRLTAMQRRQAVESPNVLDWGVAIATGLTPKVAKSLVDSMDGADCVAANHVILFLFGSGPRTGRP